MQENKVGAWVRIRKAFKEIHLWLGLISGLVIIAVCLSGTLYVFNTEITQSGAPQLYKVAPGENARLPYQQLKEQIEQKYEVALTSFTIPYDAKKSVQLNFKKEGDKSKFGTGIFMNPYTGAILGTSNDKNSRKEFMGDMFSLHRWLLLDKIEKPIFKSISNRELGSIITGTATILFTLGCITGLVIWFPKKIKNWKQGLKIKWNANWKRVNHDLHNSLAFYSLIFLLIMGLTGPQWSFEWYRTGLQKTLGTYQPNTTGNKKTEKKENQIILPDTTQQISIDEIILRANTELDYRGDYSIQFPKGENEITVTKTKLGFFAPAAGDKLVFDKTTGELKKKEIFSEKPFNERVARSIKALHVGNVYGTFTKIIYFLACLIATSLPITGTLIWINKLKKRKKKKIQAVL